MEENQQKIDKLTQYVQKRIYEILVEFHEICEENDLRYILDYGTLLGAVRHEGFIPWDDDIDVSMPREDYEKFEQIMLEKMEKEETPLFLQTDETDPSYYLPFAKLRLEDSEFRELPWSPFNMVHGPWIDIFVFDDMPSDRNRLKYHINNFNERRVFLTYITPILRDASEPNQYALKTWIKKLVIHLLRTENKILYRWIDSQSHKLNMTIKDARDDGDPRSQKMITYSFIMKDEASILHNTLYRSSFAKRKLARFEDHAFYIPEDYDQVLTERYGDYMSLPPVEERKSNHRWDLERMKWD